MRRIHARMGKPFCQVDIRLDDEIFDRAPERFSQEIVVAVLKDLGVTVQKARQKVTISYADFAMAQALGIKVNSAVFPGPARVSGCRRWSDLFGDAVLSW